MYLLSEGMWLLLSEADLESVFTLTELSEEESREEGSIPVLCRPQPKETDMTLAFGTRHNTGGTLDKNGVSQGPQTSLVWVFFLNRVFTAWYYFYKIKETCFHPL